MNHALAKVFACKCIQLACCIKVLREMRGLKLGVAGLAHIVVGKLTVGPHGAAQQSAAEGTVSERGDSTAESIRQNVPFDLSLEEIVGRLNRVKRRAGSETPHLFGRIVANADSANFALFVEFTKSGGCLLDGNERIRPVHLVNIDVVCLETTQRILEFLENTLAGGVAFDLVIRPVDADLGGEDNALPAAVLAQGFAHDLFGTPIAVDGRSVYEIDALVECRMNGANGFLLVSSAPHPAADGPGAERDSGTNEICTVDFDVFQHGCPFSLFASRSCATVQVATYCNNRARAWGNASSPTISFDAASECAPPGSESDPL